MSFARHVTAWSSLVLAAAASVACGSSGKSEFEDPPAAAGATGGGFASNGGQSAGGAGGAGGGFTGGTTSAGGSTQINACAKQTTGGELIPLDLYFMVDRSGSMEDNGKWTSVTTALKQFVALPDAAGIGVGIGFFGVPPSKPPPTSCTNDAQCGEYGPCLPGFNMCTGAVGGADSCEYADYATPKMTIATLPAAASQFTGEIGKVSPKGSTPTTPAIRGALTYAHEWSTQHPDHLTLVVFATDGEPAGCIKSNSVDLAAQSASQGWQSWGIKTVVIGVGSELGALNAIAQAGGTDKAVLVDVGGNVAKEFLDALNQLRSYVACKYQIPKPPGGQELDFGQVNVQVTSPGGQPMFLGQVPDAASCGTAGGWYYDNPSAPTKILLCDATCAGVKQGQTPSTSTKVEIVLGCMTKFG
ncbi:MAG: VWA domain-containing protein [Polyangiaceae bacterium]|nr:VWA domain-containing protein [Polyangiaceae bacterium]